MSILEDIERGLDAYGASIVRVWARVLRARKEGASEKGRKMHTYGPSGRREEV